MVVATKGLVSHNVNITIIVNARPDLAISSVTASPTIVTLGATITFTIVVQNLGPIQEQATVAALAGDQTVDSKNVTLAPYGNQTVTLHWHTDGFTIGAYVVGAKVLQVPNELNLDNNLLRSSTAVTLNPQSSSPLSQPMIIYPIVAIVVIAGIAGLILISRRSKIQSQA